MGHNCVKATASTTAWMTKVIRAKPAATIKGCQPSLPLSPLISKYISPVSKSHWKRNGVTAFNAEEIKTELPKASRKPRKIPLKKRPSTRKSTCELLSHVKSILKPVMFSQFAALLLLDQFSELTGIVMLFQKCCSKIVVFENAWVKS